MNAPDLRKELVKAMPGYDWTVHRPDLRAQEITGRANLTATGIKSSGFNRLSTLEITRTEIKGLVSYSARSAGYGTKAPWLASTEAGTLLRALRQLQDFYESEANRYRIHAADLKSARQNAGVHA